MCRRFLFADTIGELSDRGRVDGRSHFGARLRIVWGRIQSFPAFHFRLDDMQAVALVPWADKIRFSVLTFSGRTVKKLVNQFRSGLNNANGKLRLIHAFQCCSEGAHVGDFPRHQELESLFGSGIFGESY